MIPMLKERWRQLSPRERIIVMVGGILVGASLLFLVLVDPLLMKIEKLDRQAIRKSKERVELAGLAADFLSKQERLSKLEKRIPPTTGGFSLLAFMEDAANSVQIRDRIVGMQPQTPTTTEGYQETAVDLRLDGIQLPQLLALLVALEQAPYDVQVHHLQIKPKYDNPLNLDATLRIVSYAKV